MQIISGIDIFIAVAFSGLLIAAAVSDLQSRRIPNALSVAICGLFSVFAFAEVISGAAFLGAIVWPLLSAFVVFLIGAGLFALRLMGGGDVKLMAATALFAGPALSLHFVLYVTLLGGFVATGTLVHAQLSKETTLDQAKVPYGVAIAAGGLWVCFQCFSSLVT
ncbi:A24 family peptidase [Kordiimonas laminariae]|uniref:A24 family peptidase n=1 Tax=Kordiimonas laminariae TaxID=2917717 RepID=UPI001FF3F0DE|nr:prepilin peptidase [Kordiimonas laminariae]MCK0068196.1 prepilin peptidase [Kordiimonas laminariae]